MAVYGLQTDFINSLLSQYFGLETPNIENKIIYIGLGLAQEGALANTEDFTEIFDGRPLGNYKRARVIFGNVENNTIRNLNEVAFNTATEDWTTNKKIAMIGIFDTPEYMEEDEVTEVKPLIVLRLPEQMTLLKGETVIMPINSIQLTLSDI